MRQKRCKNPDCGEAFQPARSFQSWCCPDCAIAIVQHKERQKRRAETRDMRAKLNQNDRRWWIKKATTVCNTYIRMRDAKLPCVSCGRHHGGQYHAGHYRPAGNNSFLRFSEINIHKQCAPCNNHKSGNLVDYRINLIKRIGQQSVDWLDGPHPTKKWTIDELREVVDYYKRKIKDLKHPHSIV